MTPDHPARWLATVNRVVSGDCRERRARPVVTNAREARGNVRLPQAHGRIPATLAHRMTSLPPAPPAVVPPSPVSLSDQLAQVHLRGRQLSRAIGEAKKQGVDTEALLAQRKQLSQEEDRLHLLIAEEAAPMTQAPVAIERPALASLASEDLGPVTVSMLADSDGAAWDLFVASRPDASCYHRLGWHAVFQQAFGCTSHCLVARRAQRTVGVLPLIQLKSALFGNFLVSMPFLNYGGVLAEDEAARQALIEQAAQLTLSLGCSHVELRELVPSTNWPMRTDKVSMWLPLPAGEEALWTRLGSKLRAQIKKGQGHGLVVETGGVALLDDFYRVFSTNMRDLGTPVYSRRFFELVLRQAPGQPELVVGRDARGRAVAAALVLRHGERMEVPWASTLRRANALNANMVLYWNMLRHAIQAGCTTFDFGRSTADASTYRFKKQWGAEPVPLYWHYGLAPGQALPQLNPGNPKYQLAIAAWKRLPLVVANLIGPRLSRSLP